MKEMTSIMSESLPDWEYRAQLENPLQFVSNKDIRALDLLVWEKFVVPVRAMNRSNLNTMWYSGLWYLLVDELPGKINAQA